MAKAEAEAQEKKCSVKKSLLSIVERGEDQEIVIRAFVKLDCSGNKSVVVNSPPTGGNCGHKRIAEAQIDAYFDEGY